MNILTKLLPSPKKNRHTTCISFKLCQMSRFVGHLARRIDPTAIRWVINYRQADKIKETFKLEEKVTNDQIADKLDYHSSGSMKWTKQQSMYIDKHGWDKWLNSEGSLGYSHHLSCETIY